MVVTANTWDSLFGTDKLDVSLVEINGAAQTATLDTLDVLIDAIKAKTDTLGGAGAIEWTYTLTDADTGALIDGASVWVTTDSAGANVIASGTTNDSGVVTFYLDAGTYYFWRSRAGYNFTNPQEAVVS